MYKGKTTLVIIPARGGSKGLPGKNIMPLLGKPLIAWSIEQALNSKYTDKVFVSTEDDEIAKVASEYHAKPQFPRPAELAQDSSPVYEAVLYTLDEFENLGQKFDYVALMEPTSPLRKDNDIDETIRNIVDHPEADALVTVGEVHTEHPMIVKKIKNGNVYSYIDEVEKIYQRQQADKAYFPYGVIYISKVSAYRKYKTFYPANTIPHYIERWQNYEIDDLYDFLCVQSILEHQKNEK